MFIKKLKIFIGISLINSTYFLFSHSKDKGVFRTLYFIQKLFLNQIPLVSFDLINHQLYAESHLSSSINVLIENRIGHSSNLIFGMETNDFSLIPIVLPDIYLAKHNNVIIQGNSNFVMNVSNNLAINDFGFNMSNRYENIDSILYRQKENLSLLKYDQKKCNTIIESGIMLSGNFCQNYYHQIYEIMIKLIILDKAQIPDSVPLIVDEIIFKINSFTQLFESLNKTGRKIKTIGPKEIVKFGTLYYLSAVNIIPPSIKNINNILATDIVFDLKLTMQMREKLLPLKSERAFPKKIFISRKSSHNRKYNEDEVISLMKKNGFSVVSPEEYDLFEQIALFNGADSIIGASGSAFSNILFCSKGCKIICLQSQRLNISAFTTIAYSLGIDMRYCIGKSYFSDLHSGFQVDLKMLEIMMNNFKC